MNAAGVNASCTGQEEPLAAALDPLTVVGYVLQTLTIVLIVILNPLGLLVLRRASGIQETSRVFMMSLTVSDLCTGIFNAVPNLTVKVSGRWVLGDFLCTASKVVAPTLYTMSLWSLLLLTIDRYIAIIHSLRYPSLVTPHRSKVITTVLWAFVFAVYFTLFGIFMQAKVSSEGCCEYAALGVYRYGAICIIMVTLGTILILYVRILQVARRQARRIAAQNISVIPAVRHAAPRGISTKSATTVFIVTGAVFLSWSPQLIFHLLKSRGISIPQGLDIISFSVFISNSWVNVVIYYWRNKELRQALHSLISSLRC